MKIRFLGTGTSTGVPEIGCRCEVCTSANKKDNRLRSSIQVETEGRNIIIDCTHDFRAQMMPIPFRKIDALLITHEHYDHTAGIDDLRPFCRFGTVDLYMQPNVKNAIETRMPYCFSKNNYGGVPEIKIHEIDNYEDFRINNILITPIKVMHYKLPILGFRIKNMAYLTDLKILPDEELAKLKDLDLLIVSALRRTPHISHQTLEEAILLAEKIGAKETYFTHISHHLGLYADVTIELPTNMHLAYDNLELQLN